MIDYEFVFYFLLETYLKILLIKIIIYDNTLSFYFIILYNLSLNASMMHL